MCARDMSQVLQVALTELKEWLRKETAPLIEPIKIPEHISYDSLQTFHNDLIKLIATTEQLRREAYPYITPYFIFDRRRLDATLKRLQDMNNELGEFLTTKYIKAKTAEGA